MVFVLTTTASVPGTPWLEMPQGLHCFVARGHVGGEPGRWVGFGLGRFMKLETVAAVWVAITQRG